MPVSHKLLYFVNMINFKLDLIISIKDLVKENSGPFLSHVFVDISTHDDLFVEIQSG